MDRDERRRPGKLRPSREHDDHGHWGERHSPGPLPGMMVALDPRPSFLEPLDHPKWVRAEAADQMLEDDFVLGISIDGTYYALPWWVMKNHHVANLKFSEVGLVVTLCENCSSGAAFSPVVEDTALSFRVAGSFKGTFFMEDMESQTYWAPFTGEAIYGRYLGTVLEPFPLYQCYWSEWKEMHPDTLVERGENEPRDGHGARTSPGSHTRFVEKMMIKSAPKDKRLRPNVLVLGVNIGGKSRAYPFDELYESPAALNDTVGGQPIVIFSRPKSLIGMAFSRHLDGQVLNLEAIGPLKFRDAETGSEWDIEGKAVSGPLAGKRLAFVKSTVEEWYAFAAAAKDVDVFGSKARDEIEAQPHLRSNSSD